MFLLRWKLFLYYSRTSSLILVQTAVRFRVLAVPETSHVCLHLFFLSVAARGTSIWVASAVFARRTLEASGSREVEGVCTLTVSKRTLLVPLICLFLMWVGCDFCGLIGLLHYLSCLLSMGKLWVQTEVASLLSVVTVKLLDDACTVRVFVNYLGDSSRWHFDPQFITL